MKRYKTILDQILIGQVLALATSVIGLAYYATGLELLAWLFVAGALLSVAWLGLFMLRRALWGHR